LTDTGSSVSFVKYSIYLVHREHIASVLRQTSRTFVNIKNSPLKVVGTIEVKITLSLLKNRQFTVTLFVIKDQTFTHDIILGRDFIGVHNLAVTFRFREGIEEERYNKLGLFDELPLYVVDEKLSGLEDQLQQIEIDFEAKVKQ